MSGRSGAELAGSMIEVKTVEAPASSLGAADRMVFAAILVGTLARLAYVAAMSVPDLIFRTTDDSFYYFNVARNVVLGQGWTFDGMNLTNGFHPLWMFAVLPIYQITGGDSELALRGVVGLVSLLAGVTFLLAFLTVRRHAGTPAALLACIALLAPQSLNSMLNGLETGLLLLLIFLLFWAAHRFELLQVGRPARLDLLFGALLAAVFLCRLDTAFLVGAVSAAVPAIWLMGSPRPPARLLVRKICLVSVIPVVAVGAYLSWNVAQFGGLVPISGKLKSTFPTVSFEIARLVSPHRLFGIAQIAVSTLALAWLIVDQRRSGRHGVAAPVTPLLVAVWIGCVLHFANTLLFMRWAAHWWHFSSYLPLTVLLCAMTFERVRSRAARPALVLRLATAVMAAVAATGLSLDVWVRGLHHQPWYEAALAARARLPEDAVVGMTDSGIFGYFCGRPTVNLDGVINGVAYQEALRDHQLSDFLRRSRVTHIADYQVEYRGGRRVIRVPARLFRAPGGAIIATPEAEIYRSGLYDAHWTRPGSSHFAVWDIRKLTVVDDAAELDGAPPIAAQSPQP